MHIKCKKKKTHTHTHTKYDSIRSTKREYSFDKKKKKKILETMNSQNKKCSLKKKSTTLHDKIEIQEAP